MTKVSAKIVGVLAALTLALGLVPATNQAAQADDPAPSAPGIAFGPDALSLGSNTSGAATVYMAGTAWRVIGYGGDGVASNVDTMTLIAAGNLKTDVMFRDDWQAADDIEYAKSNLKSEIDKLTGASGIFSDGEKAGIVPRDLEKGVFIAPRPQYYTDGIAGDEVKDALLWPLSTKEAYGMDETLRQANDDAWWLRSPGEGHQVAVVREDGYLSDRGAGSTNEYGVRPAFNYDLDSVLFTSAAVGGKTGEEYWLNPVGTNTSNEWKLTVKDDAHKNFTVTDVTFTYNERDLYIDYSGAVTGDNEYVSVIVKSQDGKVKYYGRHGQVSDSGAGLCTVRLHSVGMEAGDKLYVFNEQLNGDKKTDYASELMEVYRMPLSPTIKTQPKDLDLAYGDTAGNTLTVEAEAQDGSTLSYQWYRKDSAGADPVPLEDGRAATYTVPTDQNVGTTKYYYCVVTATTDFLIKATTTSDVAAVSINKAPLSLSLAMEGWTEGERAKTPVLTGNEGSGAVTYKYKPKAADVSAYTTDVPTVPGEYTVRATVSETTNYLSGEATADFTITAVPPAPVPSGTPSVVAPVSRGVGVLSATGAEIAGGIVVAVLLLGLGIVLAIRAKRCRE